MNQTSVPGGLLRKQAYHKLKVFLVNPGKFCLIIVGARGTGKHFAIEKAFAEIKLKNRKDLCLEKLEFISAVNVPSAATELDALFKKHQNQTLVIEDVEKLTDEQQDLLFTALSTTDGKFGIEKKFNIRIVFISSKDIEVLREDENQLQGLFWDRISQLIVEFPSYKKESETVVSDFMATWKKMKFEDTKGFEHFAPPPKNATLEKFLEDYADKFEGGFRDLDKLACMYFNYRILLYEEKKKIQDEIEKKIVEAIKEDFISKSQLLSSKENDLSVFQIRPGFTMNDLIGQFKIQVKAWGKKEYDTYSNAEKKLKLGEGTMKNWTEKKVTQSRKREFNQQRKSKK